MHFSMVALGLLYGVSSHEIQTAVEGVSTNINIPCNLGGEVEAPFWFINGTSHELFSIPLNVPYIPMVDSFAGLTIPVVTLNLSETVFQYAIYNDDRRLGAGKILQTQGDVEAK